MFAVETFTGSAYGQWLRGAVRYRAKGAADAAMQAAIRAERLAGATPLDRRVVNAA